jgi:hypothetical protein
MLRLLNVTGTLANLDGKARNFQAHPGNLTDTASYGKQHRVPTRKEFQKLAEPWRGAVVVGVEPA